MRNTPILEELELLREMKSDMESFLLDLLPWYRRIFARSRIQKFLLSQYQKDSNHVWGVKPNQPWPKPFSEILTTAGVLPLREGDVKKGGSNSPPSIPKPKINPPGQGRN